MQTSNMDTVRLTPSIMYRRISNCMGYSYQLSPYSDQPECEQLVELILKEMQLLGNATSVVLKGYESVRGYSEWSTFNKRELMKEENSMESPEFRKQTFYDSKLDYSWFMILIRPHQGLDKIAEDLDRIHISN
jgi:hypothetical protein